MKRKKIIISILSVILLVSVLVLCCIGCDSLKNTTQISDKKIDKTDTSDKTDTLDNSVPTVVYVKGYVTTVGENKNKYQKNIYIADSASATRDNSLLVYSADYGTGITALTQGDCIIVKGFLAKYKGTPEMTSYKDKNGEYTNQEIVWKGTGESNINAISVSDAKDILNKLTASNDEVVYYVQKKAVAVNTVSGMSLKSATRPSNSDNNSSEYILVASFDNEDVISAVTWAASWLNPNSTWASGKDVSDYITLTVNPDNGMECTVSKKYSSTTFNEPIIVKVKSVSFPYVNATCRVDNLFWGLNVENLQIYSDDLGAQVNCLSIGKSGSNLEFAVSNFTNFAIPQLVVINMNFSSTGTTTPDFDFYLDFDGQELADLNAILQKYGKTCNDHIKLRAFYDSSRDYFYFDQEIDHIYDTLFFEGFLEALANKDPAAYEVAYYLAHVGNYFMRFSVYNKDTDVKLDHIQLGFYLPENFLDDYTPVINLSIDPEGIVL